MMQHDIDDSKIAGFLCHSFQCLPPIIGGNYFITGPGQIQIHNTYDIRVIIHHQYSFHIQSPFIDSLYIQYTILSEVIRAKSLQSLAIGDFGGYFPIELSSLSSAESW